MDTLGEAQLRAHITLHGFLLENLYAQLLSTAADPIAAVARAKAASELLMERATMAPQGNVELAQAFMAVLREIGPRFWDRVRRRIEDGWPELEDPEPPAA